MVRMLLAASVAVVASGSGTNPGRVLFPFRLPDGTKVKEHKNSEKLSSEENFQHGCYDFIYAVAKASDSWKNPLQKEVGDLCTFAAPSECEMWSKQLGVVLDNKKNHKKPTKDSQDPQTYSQWCRKVYGQAEVSNVKGENDLPKHTTEKTTELSHAQHKKKHESVPKSHHRTEEKAHATKKTRTEKVTLKHRKAPRHHESLLKNCVCKTHDGQEVCSCAGNIKTVDGVVETKGFSMKKVANEVEGYELGERFKEANGRLAGKLSSAIDSLDDAFGAAHKFAFAQRK